VYMDVVNRKNSSKPQTQQQEDQVVYKFELPEKPLNPESIVLGDIGAKLIAI
jgi:hypothetical protein